MISVVQLLKAQVTVAAVNSRQFQKKQARIVFEPKIMAVQYSYR